MIKNHALQHQKTSGSDTGLMSEYTHQDHGEECSTDDWYQHDQHLNQQQQNMTLKNQQIITGGGGVRVSGEGGEGNDEMNLMYSREEDNEDYSNEPPLLEELGIRFDHIFTKTQAVIMPTKVSILSLQDSSSLSFLVRRSMSIFWMTLISLDPLFIVSSLAHSCSCQGRYPTSLQLNFLIVNSLRFISVTSMDSLSSVAHHSIWSSTFWILMGLTSGRLHQCWDIRCFRSLAWPVWQSDPPLLTLDLAISVVLDLRSYIGLGLSFGAVVWSTASSTRYTVCLFSSMHIRFSSLFSFFLEYLAQSCNLQNSIGSWRTLSCCCTVALSSWLSSETFSPSHCHTLYKFNLISSPLISLASGRLRCDVSEICLCINHKEGKSSYR